MPTSSSRPKASAVKTTAGNRPNNQQAGYDQRVRQLHHASLAQQGMTFGPDGVPHIHAPKSNARPGPSAASAGYGSTPYTTGRNAGQHGKLRYPTSPAVAGGSHNVPTLPPSGNHAGGSGLANSGLVAGLGGAALLATGAGYLFKKTAAEVRRKQQRELTEALGDWRGIDKTGERYQNSMEHRPYLHGAL